MEGEYKISDGTKFFYGIIALVLFIFSVFFLNSKQLDKNPFLVLLPILFFSGAILIVANLIRQRVDIDKNRILCVNLFSSYELDLKNIKGYRIGDKIIVIESIQSTDHSINIGNYNNFSDHAEIIEWLKNNFTDLNENDLEIEIKNFTQNIEFGNSKNERIEKLKTAKQIALVYNIIGAVLLFVIIIYKAYFIKFCWLIYPLLSIPILMYSKGLIKLLSNSKRSIYGSIFIGIIFPCLALTNSLSAYNLLSYNALWLPSFIISGVFFAFLYTLGINKSIEYVKGQVFMMLIISMLYGFGSTLIINAEFDNSKTQLFDAIILDHKTEYHKHTRYYLILSPWALENKEQKIQIGKSLYEDIHNGDHVKIKLKEGFFKIPWFIIEK